MHNVIDSKRPQGTRRAKGSSSRSQKERLLYIGSNSTGQYYSPTSTLLIFTVPWGERKKKRAGFG